MTCLEDQLFFIAERLWRRFLSFWTYHAECALLYKRLSTFQHFLEKTKTIGSVPGNAILVTADAVNLYPNISHQADLKPLKKALEKRDIKKYLQKI